MSLNEFVRGPRPAYSDEDEALEAILAEALGIRPAKPAKRQTTRAQSVSRGARPSESVTTSATVVRS